MIKSIVIAGAGTMGYSMAQIFAKFGYKVCVYDLKSEALDNAKSRIKENIDILLEEKELTSSSAQTIQDNLSYSIDMDVFKDCDLVVECIIEDVNIKKQFFSQISKLVRDDTIIASNTSGISINILSSAVDKPERFIGMHWFNPPHLIPLIEIIKGDNTKQEIAQTIYDLSLSIDKKPVIVKKDVVGFAANRLQLAVLREALYLVENDVISKEGIDDVMKYGLGFRYACLGPLEVVDLGGLDVFYHVSEYLMQDLCDSHDVPKLLKEAYDEGHYGVKTKEGFYDYHDGKDHQIIEKRDDLLLKLYDAFYK
ncbi:MAG: 3-hydroxyacyl-CoA dehydrogenase family protein [Thomasclavelia sp.]|jgi:3-hydroxybutyryl-CoA dehydrogenase|nr:3-hydroxyacyl-CoA dehydrogenase family protein [Thomasclavelia sp.]